MTHAIERILKDINGASFIGLDYISEVKVNKTLGGRGKDAIPNPHYDRVTKMTTGASVMVFTNKNKNAYQAMVNRRLIAEGKAGTFQAGPRAWGTRVPNTPFVEHNGEMYLEVIFLSAGESVTLLDGAPTTETITGMPAKSSSGGQSGLDNQVIIRTIKFSNIRAIRTDGREHKL